MTPTPTLTLTQEETETLKIFKRRSKEGQVDRVQDESTVICKNLFNPGTDMNLFLNMKVQLGETGPVGYIDSTFGKTKFKCVFRDHGLGLAGLQEACKGAKLCLRCMRRVITRTRALTLTLTLTFHPDPNPNPDPDPDH